MIVWWWLLSMRWSIQLGLPVDQGITSIKVWEVLSDNGVQPISWEASAQVCQVISNKLYQQFKGMRQACEGESIRKNGIRSV